MLCTIVTRALCLASFEALVNCGITIAARMPRMITTIRISISVKPLRFWRFVTAYMGLSSAPRARLNGTFSFRRRGTVRDARLSRLFYSSAGLGNGGRACERTSGLRRRGEAGAQLERGGLGGRLGDVVDEAGVDDEVGSGQGRAGGLRPQGIIDAVDDRIGVGGRRGRVG